MVAISALTVIPSRQVNAVSTTVTLNKAIRALVNICLAKKTKTGCYTIAAFLRPKLKYSARQLLGTLVPANPLN